MQRTGCRIWCFWHNDTFKWVEQHLIFFGYWKGFAWQLDILCRDSNVKTFECFQNVKAQIDLQSKYMRFWMHWSTQRVVVNRSQGFQIHGPIFSYLFKPDLLDTTTTKLDLDLFRRMNVVDFQMQHVEFYQNYRHQNLPNCETLWKETA